MFHLLEKEEEATIRERPLLRAALTRPTNTAAISTTFIVCHQKFFHLHKLELELCHEKVFQKLLYTVDTSIDKREKWIGNT